jgi:hypothetical protein
MTNKLQKPYTNIQYAEFAAQANEAKKRIELTETAAYALAEHEVLQDGQIIDISDTPEYREKIIHEEITGQIAEIEQQFVEYMDTPIICPLNGKSYKPKWADDGTYLKVIQSFDLLEAACEQRAQDDAEAAAGGPFSASKQEATGAQEPTIKIWDATELEENTALMTKADLIRLITFLYDQAQPVYENKKQAVAELKKAAAGEIEECSDVPEEGPEL